MTYADHTPERFEVPERKSQAGNRRGLRLIKDTTIEQKIQDHLDKNGLGGVKVMLVTDEAIRIFAPDYADWLLAKKELVRFCKRVEKV